MDFEDHEANNDQVGLFAILPFLFSIYIHPNALKDDNEFDDDSDAMRSLY